MAVVSRSHDIRLAGLVNEAVPGDADSVGEITNEFVILRGYPGLEQCCDERVGRPTAVACSCCRIAVVHEATLMAITDDRVRNG